MGSIAPHHLEQMDRYVPRTPDEATSFGALAKKLGVSFGTARRRLEAYAQANGLALETLQARVGARGPRSTLWFLRPVEQLAMKDALLAALPRTEARALSPTMLLDRLTLEPPIAARWKRRWLTELVADPSLGIITTPDGRLYLDQSTARTTRIAAVRPRPGRPNSLSQRQRGEGRGEGPPRAPPPRLPLPSLPLTLPPALLTALTPDERPALAALLQVKTARTSELAQLLSTSPLRIDGMMSQLRRKLRTHLRARLLDEALSDGDTLYRLEEAAR